jgi:hypothetical protein
MKLLELFPEDPDHASGSSGSSGEKIAYESEDQLVVALDFGTTFSGIAYAFKNDEKPDIISIMDWPGTRQGPSTLTYTDFSG